MKTFKKIIFLFVAMAMIGCSEDEDETPVTPTYSLSTENLAGDYAMNSFDYETGTTQTVLEQTISLLSSESTGSTFEADATFDSNGAFTLSGEFLLTTTAGDITNTSIIDLDNISGTYTLDSDNETITLSFGAIDDLDFELDGEYNVDSFSEDTLSISKEEENSVETTALSVTTITTTSSTTSISFDRN